MAAGNEQAQATDAMSGLNEETVREYLKENPDFLQRNPDMLDHLHISHASGSAISLVEKQVSVLRERNVEMRHRLSHLTANARENDRLYAHTRATVLAMLDARDIAGLNGAFNRAMKNDFKVEHASLILFGDPPGADGCRLDTLERARIEVGALIRSHKPVCGVLREEELRYLFPNAEGVGSAALMPLVDGEEMGLIAVGSSDPHRYTTSTGTLFLAHLADIIVRLLPRLQRCD
ncbi:DUF484 family protein [Haliea sp. E17]|uniref:DUF484 family protein n=1 Tax=Haliea sp. E17 TaxID=3401576 RepID=UPI003AB02B12